MQMVVVNSNLVIEIWKQVIFYLLYLDVTVKKQLWSYLIDINSFYDKILAHTLVFYLVSVRDSWLYAITSSPHFISYF